MFIASRYLAMVLRATLMSCSASKLAILLSLRGFLGSSAEISLFIMARMAVEEHSPPEPVLTWLEKKYFSSNIPRGVCMYFWVVTLEIVDSCISTASAMSWSTSGFMASSPCSKKSIWCSTILLATFNSVSFLLCKLLINQRASCKLFFRKVLSLLLSARWISEA